MFEREWYYLPVSPEETDMHVPQNVPHSIYGGQEIY